MKEKVVLILSGGLDSTTLLYALQNQGKDIYPITFLYGQRHKKEVDMALQTCIKTNVRQNWIAYPVTALSKMGGSSLTDPRIEVPEGHYAEETMKSTVVPNRNMVFLSLAISHAIAIGADKVYYGAHTGDHTIYPDCRPEFLEALNKAAALCHYHPIKIEAPFMGMSKIDIVRHGLELGVDYSLTWTCYKGGILACGKCGSCTERLEAFSKNGTTDPLPYR